MEHDLLESKTEQNLDALYERLRYYGEREDAGRHKLNEAKSVAAKLKADLDKAQIEVDLCQYALDRARAQYREVCEEIKVADPGPRPLF